MRTLRMRPFILALCLLAGPALAASAAAPQTASRDEIRACMDAKDALAAQRQKLNDATAEHERSVSAIQAEGAALKEQKQAVAAGDHQAIEVFNRRLEAYNAESQAANARAAAIEARQVQMNATITDYNERCAGISVRPADRAAVIKEREKSAK